MDAHTLNAWTRFALQKGGIGSCTALIDNPATELEDLMFMTGEKIIVLRRLDENGNDASASGSSGNRRSVSDVDSWFLGYCEGVVGRFRGSHVQIHGKLKKPVLMRRSGVGSLRDSTTQPMSKAEAASMHVSQVPPGIPVTAVNSDGEEDSVLDAYTSESPSKRASGMVISDKGSNHLPTNSSSTANEKPKHQKIQGLGVTTPPLSDESHARRRTETIDSDSDSDESDTQLPWARSSMASTKNSRVASTDYTHETNAAPAGVPESLHQRTGIFPPQPKDGMSHLPPSPISSAESPIHARQSSKGQTYGTDTDGAAYNYPIPRIRKPGYGHTSNQSSIATTTTSNESEEDAQRRDQTFSIYDVYGRDSVAFPNIDFSNSNDKSNRLDSSKSNESLGIRSQSNNSLNMKGLSIRGGAGLAVENTNRQIPAALRSPSARRPTAAPAPPLMTSSLRNKVEGGIAKPLSQTPLTSPVISSPSIDKGDSNGLTSHFGNFDPMRRPSIGNQAPTVGSRFAARPNLPPIIDTGSTATGVGSNPNGISGSASYTSSDTNSSVPRTPITPIVTTSPFPSQPSPLGTNLYARRRQEEAAAAVAAATTITSMAIKTIASPNLQIDVHSPMNAFPGSQDRFAVPDSIHSPIRPMASSDSTLGQTSSSAGPARPFSDRDPHLRLGNGQMRMSNNTTTNSNNPQSAPHGGSFGLAAPSPAFANNGGLSTPTGSSRSVSPLSAPSPTRVSPAPLSIPSPTGVSPGPFSTSPVGPPRSPIGPGMTSGPRVLSGAGSFQGFRGVNPATVSFDKMGFVMGSGFFIPEPKENAEDVQKWNQLLAENDLISAKRSRKVKKMVQSGIPQSMRAKVWPYLANSYIRRRAGLFEELCKTSQNPKGKKGKEGAYDAIDKDLDRAFPDHRLFMGETSTGRADLEAILKAYVHYNPIVGYTQGMSLVAGFLLIQMPAEDAFWMLCALLRDIHMEGYYSNEMKQLHVDGIIFGQLLQSMDPELAARLTEMGIEPINFTPNWFLPLFTRIVPWQTLLRIWDMFLFEGPTWILRTALGIIRIIRDPLMDRRVCPEGGEALRVLLHPPQTLLTPENVIPCAISVKLKDGEMRKLSRQASKLVRTSINQTRGRGNNGGGTASASRSTSAPAPKHG